MTALRTQVPTNPCIPGSVERLRHQAKADESYDTLIYEVLYRYEKEEEQGVK